MFVAVHLHKRTTFFVKATLDLLQSCDKWGVASCVFVNFKGKLFLLCLQDVTLQHYMDYTAESLIPVMAHIAKNVVKVNDGLTKHLVSVLKLHNLPVIYLNHSD